MIPKSPDIRSLFRPESIALIGVSHNPAHLGHKILKNVISGGYRGRICPVNPKGGEILGQPVARSLEEIAAPIDVACTCVPMEGVREVVAACGERGVKFNLVISSGFSEVGNHQAERELVQIARTSGMRLLGPNIFGIYSAAASLDLTFGPGDMPPGNVAIITQSGALGLAMIGMAAVENIGISAMVSVGNKADLGEADLLAYLVNDPLTQSILLYIEGIRAGRPLIEALQRTTRKKPVVVIKAGRSRRGAAAAASHTGSLAGSDDVFAAIMRQCGVLRAEGIADGFNLCKTLSGSGRPRGRNGVIITNGGGIGVLATDACEEHGIGLLDDGTILHETFQSVTPAFGSTRNPIDLTGQATAEHYRRALQVALDNDQIHAVVAIYGETAVCDAESIRIMIKEAAAAYAAAGKPIVFTAFGGHAIGAILQSFTRERIPVFANVADAVYCLGGLYTYSAHLAKPQTAPSLATFPRGPLEQLLQPARAQGRTFLLAEEGRRLMDLIGLAHPPSRIVRTLDEALGAAEMISYPVALKIVSRDILHKSDCGGVALDLENRTELIDAFQAVRRNARAAVPTARILGVEVAAMVPPGFEFIVGARRDPSFGPIVMFGLGGIYVEVLHDVSFRAVPTSRAEVLGMLEEIRAYPLLLGVRGEKRRDIASVVDAILMLANLINTCDSITDIEINPLVTYEDGEGSLAVDMRVMLGHAPMG